MVVNQQVYFLSFVRGNSYEEPYIDQEKVSKDGWHVVGNNDRGGFEICCLVKLVKNKEGEWAWPSYVKLFKAKNQTHLIIPAEEKAIGKDLCIVFEYSPGTGAKRWPSFYINENDPAITCLSRSSRTCGSGAEYTRLIIAPEKYDENIAGQFVDERDAPSQTLSYTHHHV